MALPTRRAVPISGASRVASPDNWLMLDVLLRTTTSLRAKPWKIWWPMA